jgi:uncharacterized membrane protein YdjX (TVP38/TMEM64 family)
MTVWYKARAYKDRALSLSGKTVLALGLLAVLLVAAVPAALFVGVILMLFGHVIGGLALFGASILAAGVAVVAVSLGGVRHLRKLVSQHVNANNINVNADQPAYRMVQLGRDDYQYE